MSTVQALLRWRKERVSWPLFVGIAMAIALAADNSHSAAACVVAAFVWVITFRLWDDIEDREHDAIKHPERVMTQVPAYVFTTPLFVALLVSWAIAWLLECNGGFSLLVGSMTLWYRLRGADRWLPVRLVVTLKYPAFAYLLSQRTSLVALLVLWSVFVIDEALSSEET